MNKATDINNDFSNQGAQRTEKVKKNVLFSVLLKGLDVAVYLLIVPATLGYLNKYEYGLWLTLNSILMWINSFDIGLGNGLRNRLAEALVSGNKELGRIYVSTTFVMLTILSALFIIVGSAVCPFIDWYSLLNANPALVGRLDEIVYMSFVIFAVNFTFRFIGNVYLALQMPAVNNLLIFLGNFFALAGILIITFVKSGGLFMVAFIYSVAPLFVYVLAYPVTFGRLYPYLRPSFSLFKKEYLGDLFNIGVKFFLLQLSAILLFAFANILISQLFGPDSVTPYNISYRYFSLIPMAMNLLLAPMWSATTDAFARGEIDWIKKTKRKTELILFGAIILIAFQLSVSGFFYRIWVGSDVSVGWPISILMAIYIAILIASLTYSSFLNGIGKLQVQVINTVSMAILFYPVCYVLGYKFGIAGVIGGMCLLNISGLILNFVQFHKILNGKAHGIWNR